MFSRLKGAQNALAKASLLPVAVRAGAAFCALIALAAAWPTTLFVGRYFPLFLLVAIYPAVAPRGRAGTLAALVVVGGWLLDTTFYDSRVALWRVLTIATTLYLGHTLTALAAVLPLDAVVNLDVVGTWLARALAVVLISGVLTVVALGLATELAGGTFLIATLVGIVGAVTATLLLARLVRRP
ncbi:MAG: hypothetical protein ABW046_16925 [Actinoplanes sp.]